MRTYKIFAISFAILVAFELFAARALADTWQLTSSNVNLDVSGNFGIDKFAFNTTLSNITPSEISLQDGWSVNASQQESSFGSFEFEYKGTGNSRTDPLTFSITDPGITSAARFYAPD